MECSHNTPHSFPHVIYLAPECDVVTPECYEIYFSIDISLIKQEVHEMNGRVRWVDGRMMLADSLTKDTRGDFLREVMASGKWSILEEGAALQQKLVERGGERSEIFLVHSIL